MQRRVFLVEAGKALPVVAGAVYLIGCGGPWTSPSEIASIGGFSSVSNTHIHLMRVPASDQIKARATTYTSSSVLEHDHMVTLSDNQLSTLAAGGSVTATSTNSTVTGNHTHDFTFQGMKV